jgi:hypothetical protein
MRGFYQLLGTDAMNKDIQLIPVHSALARLVQERHVRFRITPPSAAKARPDGYYTYMVHGGDIRR